MVNKFHTNKVKPENIQEDKTNGSRTNMYDHYKSANEVLLFVEVKYKYSFFRVKLYKCQIFHCNCMMYYS